jgi:glycosyltransferase involved in cell wall biosynthesis
MKKPFDAISLALLQKKLSFPCRKSENSAIITLLIDKDTSRKCVAHEGSTMHILMISDVYFPRINGVSTSIQTFRRNLVDMGHKVTLIAPEYEDVSDDETDIIRIPARTVIVDKEDKMMKRRFIRTLIPELKQQAIDLIHIQTPFVAHYEGVNIANVLGIPSISSYHTFFEEYFYNYIKWLPKPWLRYAARAFSRSQCQQVNALLVPSSPMHDVLRGYGIDAPMHILPTGLKLDDFASGDGESFREQHNIAREQPCIAFVGRIAHEKNIRFLLTMFSLLRQQIPNACFLIAGDGPALPNLKKQCQQLGLNDAIHFVGYLNREGELQSCYKAADVFVFASRTETQGLVLLEAMACGTPVVSTAVMGTKDVMKDGEGGLIAPEDEALFADKVARLLLDTDTRQHMQEKAIAYAAEWSQENMTLRLLTHYQTLIEHHDS